MISLREKLSDHMHYQWSYITNWVINNSTTENLERWKKQITTPYSELSELDKNKDRVWADKIIKICADYNDEVNKREDLNSLNVLMGILKINDICGWSHRSNQIWINFTTGNGRIATNVEYDIITWIEELRNNVSTHNL